jgi:adenosylcobinamide-phosphate synthase
MFSAFALALALAALLIESLIGYPAPVYATLRHPVSWIGALIARLEQMLNRPEFSDARRKLSGALALVLVLTVTGAIARLLTEWAPANGFGFIMLALLASSLVAQRSLYDHVAAVAEALERGGLEAGREKVAMIVGRDVSVLDVAGVSRAAVESLAENFSDGVVAPAFWIAALGLPGGALYKAANTADSMIGHRNARYEQFGWAAARFDDLVNLPASRLAALWILLAAAFTPRAEWRGAWAAVRRDAGKHRSPNAGWPEAAMAGALGFKLAGPRVYHGERVDDVYMGDGNAALDAADIRQALKLYRRACAAQMLCLSALLIIATR